MKNNYVVEDDIIKITLHRRNSDDLITIIDREDFDKVNAYAGTFYASQYIKLNGKFYVKITLYLGTIDGKPKYKIIRLHRIILNCNDDDIADHINGDTLDNRKINLRTTNFKGNSINRTQINSNNETGIRNVSYYKGWYLVQIQVNGKNKVLKKFKNVDEAGEYANSIRSQYYGNIS